MSDDILLAEGAFEFKSSLKKPECHQPKYTFVFHTKQTICIDALIMRE